MLFLINNVELSNLHIKFTKKIEIMKFFEAYNFTKPAEGLYSIDKDDKGNETFMGISRKWHKSLHIWKVIDEAKSIKTFPQCLLTNNRLLDEVMVFYKIEFWDKLNIERIKDSRLQIQIYDWAITSWDDAVKMIQKLVGVIPDGVIGLKTLEAINGYPDKDELLSEFIEGRKQHYNNIVIEDPTQKKWLQGWLNRVENCLQYSLKYHNFL